MTPTTRKSPGRPAKLTKEQQAMAAQMLMKTNMSVAEVARRLKCKTGNIYRTVGSKAELLALEAKKAQERQRRVVASKKAATNAARH